MPPRTRRKPSFIKRHPLWIIAGVLFVVAIFILAQLVPDFSKSLRRVAVVPQVASNLVFYHDINLNNDNGRINILLLGIAGGNHDGPLLSDTIIFVSINPEKKKTTLISIPRDIWVPSMHAKINSAYAFGEEKQKGYGLIEAKSVISEFLGQPIHYTVRIDFSGFEKMVDELGGLNVNVEHTLDDYAYPITGKEDDPCGKSIEQLQAATASADNFADFPCRYEHLHVDSGKTHMDGETALKFVRSRHGIGSEGSDFARSHRQQLVISAMKEKIFSLQVLLNPVKLNELANTLGDSIDTDIKTDDYDDFIRLAQKLKDGQIINAAIDQGDNVTGRPALLINPPITQYDAWVLEPKNDTQLKTFVSCEITHVATSSAENPQFCGFQVQP